MILRSLLRKDIFPPSPENSLTILFVRRKKEKKDAFLADEDDSGWKREKGEILIPAQSASSQASCECETCCQVVSVRTCTKPYKHTRKKKRRVRVARAARFYRFRASACSRAAANCSLMQASERVAFLGCRGRASFADVVNDENVSVQ